MKLHRSKMYYFFKWELVSFEEFFNFVIMIFRYDTEHGNSLYALQAVLPYELRIKRICIMKVLVIEDSIRLSDTIAEALQKENYQVDIANDGQTGYEYAATDIYDIVILDLMLPKMNGYDVLSTLRQNGHTVPVLILSAKTELDDKLQGFTAGADDYVTKPFEIRELLMRIQAISRRHNKQDFTDLIVGNLSLDSSTCTAKNIRTGKEMQITGKEMQLLEFFMNNCNQVLEKEQITTKIWGFDSNAEYNNVEVYVSFLRRKFKHLQVDVTIRTIRGIGYIMEVSND